MKNKPTIFLYFGALVLFIVVILVLRYVGIRRELESRQSGAEGLAALDESALSTSSNYVDNTATTFFTLTAANNDLGLYTVGGDSSEDMVQFLAREPLYVSKKLIPDSPANFLLTGRLDDRQAGFLNAAGTPVDATHYYFQQKRCNNVPVFGASLGIHVGASNNIYHISGAMIKTDATCTATINQTRAHEIALDALKKVDPKSISLSVRQSEPAILNLQLVGVSDDVTNYFTQRVTACNENDLCKIYFVDLKTGRIVHDFQITSDLVNRKVTADTGASRTEGQPAVGDQAVNNAYDFLGSIYSYYSTTHNRDSIDGAGGQIWTHIASCAGPNAFWNGQRITLVCPSLATKDIIAHELQHGVTEYAVQRGVSIRYWYESGALNESLSDIFGYANDPDDWTMGEGSGIGVIRDLSNPPAKGHPDREFSAKYYCRTCTDGKSCDNGGVHINSGVLNKAFYLMVTGGAFPNTTDNIGQCQISGIGKEKAHLIIYRALITYLKGKTTANYADMYTAVNQACADLYNGATSAECINVKSAMQAVQMDQQKVGCSQGPKCPGTCAKAEVKVTCDGASGPQVTPSPSVTSSPNQNPTPSIGPSSAPTNQPTAVPTVTPPISYQQTAPLKSLISLPNFQNGQVKTEYDGKLFKLTADLTSSVSLVPASNELPMRGELIGPDTVKTGLFVLDDNGAMINRFSSPKDMRQYTAYQVSINGSETDNGKDLPILLADLSPQTTPNPQESQKVSLDMTIRLQGISKKPKYADAMFVKVGITGGKLKQPTYLKVPFFADDDGLWRGRITTGVAEGDYCLLIKPPRHTQRKFCDNNASESSPGEYKGDVSNITLNKGVNLLDFRNVIQLAGDLPLPEQDGVVNSRDILKIRKSLQSNKIDDILAADVNNDGVINASDDALVIFTLGVRTDQN